jgi:hypothetical protein
MMRSRERLDPLCERHCGRLDEKVEGIGGGECDSSGEEDGLRWHR